MRTLQTQEVKTVSGAGLIVGTLTTGAQAGKALLGGMVQAGAIVAKPVVQVGTALFKVLI
ncbi:MAG: hypothetical protein RI907_3829 [Pseudomonadota bacterium]|jgi:hypothetical protein